MSIWSPLAALRRHDNTKSLENKNNTSEFLNSEKNGRSKNVCQHVINSHNDILHSNYNEWTITRVGKLSVKGQIVNDLNVEGHMFSVSTTQLSWYTEKAAIDHMSTNESGCFPIEFYLQNRQHLVLAQGW